MTANDEVNYKNNPLHGVSLKKLLSELIDHYGFEILFAYLNINCFKTNPSIDSSVKFLKKTEWAREKVESFYLYSYKSLPRASDQQFQLSPRDRIVPEDHVPGSPAELNLEDAKKLREKRARKASSYPANSSQKDKRQTRSKNSRVEQKKEYSSNNSDTPVNTDADPWAKSRAMLRERKK